MVYHTGGAHKGALYYCPARNKGIKSQVNARVCDNPLGISEKYIQGWLDTQLRLMLDNANPAWFEQLANNANGNDTRQLEALQNDITSVEKRIASLILQRIDTPASSQYVLTNVIQDEDKKLTALKHQSAVLQQRILYSQRIEQSTQTAYQTLCDIGIDRFWTLPTHEINRLLAMLLGRNRLVVRDARIIGVFNTGYSGV